MQTSGPPCQLCAPWEGFRETRSDGDASRRPASAGRAERLGWCEDDDEVVRCPACGALWLHWTTRDGDTGTSHEALTRLARGEAVQRLLAVLARYPDQDKSAAERALDELLGPPPPLVELLPRARPGDGEALYQLARLGPAAAAARPALLPHAGQELVARVLGVGGAVAELAEAAARGSAAAVRGLGRTGAREAVPALIALLRDGLSEAVLARLPGIERWATPSQVAVSAAGALARLGAGEDALGEYVERGAISEAREAAALALGRLRATATLLRLLRSPDWTARWRAAQGLALAGVASPEVVDGLRQAALEPLYESPIARAEAFRTLIALGVDAAALEELLRAAAAHPAEAVRRSVASFRQDLPP